MDVCVYALLFQCQETLACSEASPEEDSLASFERKHYLLTNIRHTYFFFIPPIDLGFRSPAIRPPKKEICTVQALCQRIAAGFSLPMGYCGRIKKSFTRRRSPFFSSSRKWASYVARGLFGCSKYLGR